MAATLALNPVDAMDIEERILMKELAALKAQKLQLAQADKKKTSRHSSKKSSTKSPKKAASPSKSPKKASKSPVASASKSPKKIVSPRSKANPQKREQQLEALQSLTNTINEAGLVSILKDWFLGKEEYTLHTPAAWTKAKVPSELTDSIADAQITGLDEERWDSLGPSARLWLVMLASLELSPEKFPDYELIRRTMCLAMKIEDPFSKTKLNAQELSHGIDKLGHMVCLAGKWGDSDVHKPCSLAVLFGHLLKKSSLVGRIDVVPGDDAAMTKAVAKRQEELNLLIDPPANKTGFWIESRRRTFDWIQINLGKKEAPVQQHVIDDRSSKDKKKHHKKSSSSKNHHKRDASPVRRRRHHSSSSDEESSLDDSEGYDWPSSSSEEDDSSNEESSSSSE